MENEIVNAKARTVQLEKGLAYKIKKVDNLEKLIKVDKADKATNTDIDAGKNKVNTVHPTSTSSSNKVNTVHHTSTSSSSTSNDYTN
eukprot:10858526-Heterocapsa_arctica.AAC.1